MTTKSLKELFYKATPSGLGKYAKIIERYGTSLEETRALVSDLGAALEAREYKFLPSPVFMTETEASKYGIELAEPLPEDWLLKLTPTEGEAPTISFITPEKWEIVGEDEYISPEGERYTREELEALMEPTPTGPAIPPARQFRMMVEQGLIPEGSRFLGIEDGQIQFIPPGEAKPEVTALSPEDLARVYGEQELYRWTIGTQYEAHEALRKIFPEETINEILNYAGADPEGFVGELLEAGRSKETEAILKFMGATEAEIGEIFGEMPAVAEMPEIPEEGLTVTLTNPEAEYTPEVPNTQDITIKPDYSVWVGGKREGSYDPETQQFIPYISLWRRILGGITSALKKVGIPSAYSFTGTQLYIEQVFDYEELKRQIETLPEGSSERLKLEDELQNTIGFSWGEIEEKFEAMPWWRQLLYELPTWLVIGAVTPAAGAIRAKLLARRGVEALLPPFKARIVAGALRPIASVEALLARLTSPITRRLAIRAYNRWIINDALPAHRQWLVSQGLKATPADEAFVRYMTQDTLNKFVAAYTGRQIAATPGLAQKSYADFVAQYGTRATSLYQSQGMTINVAREIERHALKVGDKSLATAARNLILRFERGARIEAAGEILIDKLATDFIIGYEASGGKITQDTIYNIMKLASKEAEKYFPLMYTTDIALQGADATTHTIVMNTSQNIMTQGITPASITPQLVESFVVGQKLSMTLGLLQALKVAGFSDEAIQLMGPSEAWANLLRNVTPAPSVVIGEPPPPMVAPATFEGVAQPQITEMTIPPTEGIIKASIEPNMARTLFRAASNLPGGKGIVGAIDPRALVPHVPETIADAINKNAIVWREINKIGQGIKAVKLGSLSGITTDAAKMFAFNTNALSTKMINRLLPEHKGVVEAGTLEHVFTHPEMYNWTGFRKGFDYVTRVHEINTEVLNLLRAEGVAPENVTEEWWIHRVVEGKYDANGELIEIRGRPGMRGRFAAKRAFDMHRKAPTMYEGMSWKIKYSEKPEASVSTYIEEAYRKIANARFYEAVDKDLEAIGMAGKLPVELLKERFPEIAERAETTAERAKDLGEFHKVVSRAVRGEIPPTQTLNAIQKRFPELGRRFRELVQEPATEIKQLRELLNESQKAISQLESQLKAKEIKPETVTPQVIPDELKLAEAFGVMSYEDRLAFRSTMDNQLEELAQMIYEHEAELAGLEEFLKNDPVASYRVTRTYKTRAGKTVHRHLKLIDVLVAGQFPETVTAKQAAFLLMKPIERLKMVEAGRVKRDYVIDELADHFKMTEQELIDQIENVATQIQTVKDLRHLIRLVDGRLIDIKRMLEILNSVDVKPEFIPQVEPEVTIPKAEPGMPEAGLQKDMFGYTQPVFPAGKGEVTQISMDEYNRLIELRKAAGLEGPPPNVAIKPAIEGITEKPEFAKVTYGIPKVKTVNERKVGLEALRKEVKGLVEGFKPEYWRARYERQFKLESIRQAPGIGKGYIMASHFGGKIYDQEFIDAVNKFMGHDAGFKVLKFTSNAAGILRVTKAAMDFSFMAIQGLPAIGLAFSTMATNPIKGARMMAECIKAVVYPVRAVFDPEWMYRYLGKMEAEATQRNSFGGSSVAVDFFEKAKQLGFIPGKPYERFELAFFGAGELIRNPFWEAMKEEAIRTGNEFQLARFLDRLTGIISTEAMGVSVTIRQLESSFVWFAPRYTRACLTLLANCFRGGYTGAKARRALGGMIAAGILMYSVTQYGISKLQGKSNEEAWEDILGGFGVVRDPITKEWSWKPSARMMTFKIGNYYMGIGGFWYGLVRLSGNIMATINEVGDRERIDLFRIMKNGSFNKRDNPFIYWWFSRSSPLNSFMFEAGWPLLKSAFSGELQAGADFFGYPIETWQEYVAYMITRFEPIWMEQGLNPYIPYAARDYEIPEDEARLIVPIVELFGMRSFPEGGWTIFYDRVNELLTHLPEDVLREYFTEDELAKILEAQEGGKLNWSHLPKPLQQRLLTMYPELKELYDKALADSGLRGSGVWKQWEGQVEAEKTKYYDYGNNLVDRLMDGGIDTRELRELWSDAGSTYGSGLETIEATPFYKLIYDYFEQRQAEGVKYDWKLSLALQEYTSIMFADYLDANGDMDWDARDRAVDAYIEEWGEETYEIIRQMYADKKLMEGLSPVLARLAEDKDKLGREYWRLPWKPIIEMDEDEVPAEFLAQWKAYQALKTDAEREAFLKTHPDMAKDWRAEYRKANPEADAMLALWGYGGKLQTREAYDLVSKWSQELGVPLAQMGLGLPPGTLIDAYFEHADIVRETSGNSIEARLYKLQHPNWLAWGVDNWGWDDLSDENVGILSLRVQFKEQFAEYDTLEIGEARADFLETNPEFQDAYYRVEAYTQGYSEENWDKFVEYSKLPQYGDWRERFLLDPANKSFYDEYIGEEVGEGHILIDPSKVSPLKRDELYLEFEEQFRAWDDTAGLTQGQVDKMRDELLKVEGFADARYRVQAYDIGLSEKLHDNYIEWYISDELKKPDDWEYNDWWGDDRFLVEHPEFEDAMVQLYKDTDGKHGWKEKRDLSGVPSRKIEDLYQEYQDIKGDDASYERLLFRYEHRDLDEWMFDTDRVSETMAEKEREGWKPEPVLTGEQQKLVDVYNGAPVGGPRLHLRCQNEWLDNYLVETEGLVPCYGTYRCGVGEKEEFDEWVEYAEREAGWQELLRLMRELGLTD